MNKTRLPRVGAVVSLVTSTCLLWVAGVHAQLTCPEPHWLATDPISTVDGTIYSSTKWDPDGAGPSGDVLVYGGAFTVAQSLIVNGIAAWDGQAWSAIGSGVTGQSPVVAAIIDWNGDLIIGGQFTKAGDANAMNVARWNRASSAWQNLGAGLGTASSRVHALAMYHGELIAGGTFSVASNPTPVFGLARWNGTAWTPLAPGISGGASPAVRALSVVNDQLIVTGSFQNIGGLSVNGIAAWNGSEWMGLGSGLVNGGNTALGLCVCEHADQLILGGDFDSAGGVPALNVARWDGQNWHAMGAGLGLAVVGSVSSVRVLDGELFAGGAFSSSGPKTALHIAKWDGTNWIGQNGWKGTSSSYVEGVTSIERLGAQTHIAGGFTHFHKEGGRNIVRDVGGAWTSLAPGFDGTIESFTLYNGALVAAGNFVTPEGQMNLATYDGEHWSDVSPDTIGFCTSVLGTADGLYVGATFNPINPTTGIKKWNGTTWSTLGDGIKKGTSVARPNAMLETPSGVVVGGNFDTAGGIACNHIARWTGTEWLNLGAGLKGTGVILGVYALASWNGDVIAGGKFTEAGSGPALNIARWNGAQWSAFGSGLGTNQVNGPRVHALCVFNGDLYASGTGSVVKPGDSGTDVALWDPGVGKWFKVGTAFGSSTITSMVVFEGELIVTGSFTMIESSPFDRVAKWDGRVWSALALSGGLRGTSAIGQAAFVNNRTLHIGGLFSLAGGQPAGSFAKLGCPVSACYPDCDANAVLDIDDFICFQTIFALGEPSADCDESGSLDIDDFICFQTSFALGC